jgi:tetratricopeptide (TPR) repeat protein
LQAAYDAGYREEDVRPTIAESYFSGGETQQGIDYVKKVVAEEQAAGRPVNEQMIRRALRFAYEGQMADQATELSALLVTSNPTQESWKQGLQVVNAMVDLEPQAQLDLLRLMLATDALSERREYVTYIEAADVRVMSNEVQRVLAKGLQAGIFTASDDYYSEVKRLADQRAPIDQREAAGLATEARGEAQGTGAQGAGDVQMSLADYAQAEAMYQLALEKGGVDRDRNLTRLGIAQAMQGKAAEAKATLQQVSGPRAAVARMWMAYADTKSA